MVPAPLSMELPRLTILCSRGHDSPSGAQHPQNGPEEHGFPDISWHKKCHISLPCW